MYTTLRSLDSTAYTVQQFGVNFHGTRAICKVYLWALRIDVTKRRYFAHIDILQVIRIAYLFLSISTPLSRNSAFDESNECAFFSY